MSFVMLSMMRNSLADRSFDSKANILNGSNRMMGMLANPGGSPQQAMITEKQITADSIQNQTMSKFCDAQKEGLDKLIDKDIKRSLSYFA
jgi:hypothetical protein